MVAEAERVTAGAPSGHSLSFGLPALAVVAAATDAVSYLGLGKVFPANMTGNTVLLGLGVAQGDFPAAARSACALGGFVFGAVVVGAVPSARRGPRALWVALVCELALLVAVALWWSVLGGPPAGGSRYGLIALAGTAMGTQSAAVAWLQVPAVSTTYITGTWTSVATRLGTVARSAMWPGGTDPGAERISLKVFVLSAYSIAALVTGYVYRFFDDAAVFVPAVVLGLIAVALLVRPQGGFSS